ncbi:SRPBCC family protein [Dongia sedimenti]|uniref:SRPBCC family protein n=1 Tax=Dongia sedimenti TaxID=3064282 RepID=A0ABU0YKD7_9PROT|nr:SRPBCC family protein [Rhodospirillaceae bacterium R-7]
MNDNRRVTIAPVRKSIRVAAPQAHAFEVFTAGLDRWWPKSHHLGASAVKLLTIEPWIGGRWYELGEDGTETTVGHILVWEPPSRFVVTWEISSQWKSDPGRGSEVELRFVAEGEDNTLVELEHRLFERMGAEHGTVMHDAVDRGWPQILQLLKEEAENQRRG